MGEVGVALILVFTLFWNAASAGSISVLECALIRWLGGCCRCVGPSALLYLWAAQTASTVSDPVTDFCGCNILSGFPKRCNNPGGSDGVVNVFQTIWLYWTSSIFRTGKYPQEIWSSLQFETAGYLLRDSNVLLDSWTKTAHVTNQLTPRHVTILEHLFRVTNIASLDAVGFATRLQALWSM